jgi:3-dehydroquinate synthase
VVVPGGEAAKRGWARARAVADRILQHRLDRQSFVVVIGGGAVLDVVGFAASLVHRGLRVVRLPTTVLAQNDSGVGVKTGVNVGGKNLLGTFAPPFAVINDFDFLDTLPDREWRGGIAEAFKVALIKDAAFFRWLCRHAAALGRRRRPLMERLIRRCAGLHLEHIRTSGDPFELGRARPLDFGHWAAHRLEILTGYRLGHGQAVAVGIALDACYAARRGWLARADFDRLRAGLAAAGLPIWHPALERRDRRRRRALLEGLRDFREHLGGELCVTLPRGVGRKFEVHEIDEALMTRCVRELQPRAHR